MGKSIGEITGINGNIIKVRFDHDVRQNEVAYAITQNLRLKSEVIRIKNNIAELQVFESTKSLKNGDAVEFSGELLSVELGPGLLGSLFDGLQNPLNAVAELTGFFLEKGIELRALDNAKKWDFTPLCKKGDKVSAGDHIGFVHEGIFEHKIMVPFFFNGIHEITEISKNSEISIDSTIATLKDEKGKERPLTMSFRWPVKQAVRSYAERLFPDEQLITRNRIIDTLFPVAKGGTYCIPGPFGAGKTVLQQLTSRHAKIDIVIIAACGERANEVVETIKEFPELIDPHTGKSLMERTVIICNTSSMPVAARESSVYTAVTIAEYYRQMGLDVLMLADSTSRWAQAVRERSGRLEEIPGEEAFPAYLESLIAEFYERAGAVKLSNGSKGSVTIGGTISPAGGNFDEPVTRSTLKVVGAFHALSGERADARRFPAISPLESWSRYKGIIPEKARKQTIAFLARASEIDQMMKVIGEEGTSIHDFIIYLKAELFDAVYLQQNAFDEVDASTPEKRQIEFFSIISRIMNTEFIFQDKEEARSIFYRFRQLFIDYNCSHWDSKNINKQKDAIESLLSEFADTSLKESSPHLRQALIETNMEASFRKPSGLAGYRSESAALENVGAERESDEESI
ncbi:V-type ATP synthase subunit A [Desulforegula conservatrix]|uniref:V-type ATP synthase subunit A n=1 Tax=Desulforegula conservatrix TaxID=153026 RepID=UPI000403CC04|nr:V-type ATP synthase subunit A [Desulforegula conservatrix]